MIFDGVVLGEMVPFALFGNDMHELRKHRLFPDRTEDVDHRGDVVTVNRSEIADSHVFEQLSGEENVLYREIDIFNDASDALPHTAAAQPVPDFRFDPGIPFVGEHSGKVT